MNATSKSCSIISPQIYQGIATTVSGEKHALLTIPASILRRSMRLPILGLSVKGIVAKTTEGTFRGRKRPGQPLDSALAASGDASLLPAGSGNPDSRPRSGRGQAFRRNGEKASGRIRRSYLARSDPWPGARGPASGSSEDEIRFFR